MQEGAEQSSVARSGSLVGRVLLAQLAASAALAVLLWGIYGRVAGYSALLGGLTCVIPNGFLALRLILPRREAGAGALLRATYIGELGKVALTVIMFSVIFAALRPLSGAALFAGFIVAQLVTFAGFLMKEDGQQTNVDTSKK